MPDLAERHEALAMGGPPPSRPAPACLPALGRRAQQPAAALGHDMLLFVAPFPFILWGAHELRRYVVRRKHARRAPDAMATVTS